jgi:hypothetical protein
MSGARTFSRRLQAHTISEEMQRKLCLSNFVTVSDEAFALTVLENFYERWIEEGKSKVDGKPLDADKLPSAKWTQGNSRSNKRGWSSDGIQKFNANKTAVEMHQQLDDSVKLVQTSRHSCASHICTFNDHC